MSLKGSAAALAQQPRGKAEPRELASLVRKIFRGGLLPAFTVMFVACLVLHISNKALRCVSPFKHL